MFVMVSALVHILPLIVCGGVKQRMLTAEGELAGGFEFDGHGCACT